MQRADDRKYRLVSEVERIVTCVPEQCVCESCGNDKAGKWHGIRLEWADLSLPGTNHGRIYIDGNLQPETLALNRTSENGIGYVHLLSMAERTDNRGFLVESVAAEAT